MQGGVAKLGLLLGGAVLIGGAKKAIARAEEMNSAYAATEQILVATGGAANLTGQQLKGLATESSLLTGIDKALVIEGQNILLTFKNVREEVGEGNDIFSRAQDIMLDFSAVMKTDAKSGAIQLGKALNDPILGISALSRVGVQFTDVQKEQIRLFQESGDIMGAQKVILAELEGQVGGVAAATADSTAKISNAWKEVQEQIGLVLLPAIDALVPAMIRVGKAAPSSTRAIGLGFSQVTRQLQGLVDLADIAAGPFLNLEDAWSSQQEILFQVNRRMIQYTEGIVAGKDESDLFVSVLADLIAKGDFWTGSLKTLIEATGISGAEFKEAALFALGNAEALGITEEAADLLKRELNKLAFGTSAMSTAAGESLGPLDDMAGGLANVATKGADALASIKEVKTTARELVDPVFALIQANKRYEETLERVQEDSVLTADESAELSLAIRAVQDAADEVTPETIIAFELETSGALRRLDDSTIVSSDLLAGLPISAEAGFDATTRAFSRLVERPLKVELKATLPTADSLDRAIVNSLTRIRRNRPNLFP